MIKIVTDYGFCYGVKNAIDTFSHLKRGKGTIYLTHPILHNEEENRKWMESLHARFISSDTILSLDDTVVLSAHGHTIEEENAYKGRAKIVDLTCPLILARNKSIPAFQEGVSYFYLGKKDHQETIGFLSRFPYFQLIDAKGDVIQELLSTKVEKKIVFVPQTTAGSDLYHQVLDFLRKKGDVIFSLPLCPKYASRALSSAALAKELDPFKACFLVCGDPSSSNAKEILSSIKKANPALFASIVMKSDEVSSFLLKKDIYITSATSVSSQVVLELQEGLIERSKV